MKQLTRRHLLVGLSLLCTMPLAWATPYQTPVQNTASWRTQWHDAKRARDVPVKIYYPTGKGPFPVIIFSHGLGGTREGYSYLGQYWAAHGYVAVHLQHIGSDDAVWRNGGMTAMGTAMNGKNSLDRARDVSFAIDRLQEFVKSAQAPLAGKLDLARIGMAGHSFGANTVLVVSGLKLALAQQSLADPRIKCALAMSSPAPRGENYSTIYGDIKIPMLHMTGTQDTIAGNGTDASDRRLPFDYIQGADSYLTTFAGGGHMLFSGRSRNVASDERNHVLILQSSVAFWDAYLKGDAKSLTWLRSDFAKELGTSGVFEQKRK